MLYIEPLFLHYCSLENYDPKYNNCNMSDEIVKEISAWVFKFFILHKILYKILYYIKSSLDFLDKVLKFSTTV